MGEALKKVNFFIEDDIRKELEDLVPSGQRAKVINEALRKELLRLKREKITQKLMVLKSTGVRLQKHEIVKVLRKDRMRI